MTIPIPPRPDYLIDWKTLDNRIFFKENTSLNQNDREGTLSSIGAHNVSHLRIYRLLIEVPPKSKLSTRITKSTPSSPTLSDCFKKMCVRDDSRIEP
jgi:hypothetical protein